MNVTEQPLSESVTPTNYGGDLNPILDILFGLICCFCFLSGTVGNFAAFCFFKFSKSNVPHSIYKIITTTDFYISLCIFPVGMCYFMDRSPGILFGTRITCYFWGYTWTIAGRLSVFLVVVLSSTRTCLVLKPFFPVRIFVVIGSIVGYFLFILIQMVLIQVLMNGEVKYMPSFAECAFLAPKETDGVVKNYKILYFIGYTAPFILPMFVVIFSCGLTIYAIAIKPKQNDSHTQVQAASSARVTWTILIFTLVYSCFNIPLVFDRILLLLRDLFEMENLNHYHSFPNVNYYLNFTYCISVAVNSALNPWLYLWRMANFRRFLSQQMHWMFPLYFQNTVGCSPGSYRAGSKRGSNFFETTSFIS